MIRVTMFKGAFVKTVDAISTFYPDVKKEYILKTWNRNKTRTLYNMGYGFCGSCDYMIKTDIRHCKICGRQFRRTTRNKKWRDRN
jgi:hypothetical protein